MNPTVRFFAILVAALLGWTLIYFACTGESNPKKAEPAPKFCDKSDAWQIAQGAVEAVLKNPDEAEFHNPYGWDVEIDPKHDGQYIVTGQVTATNSFNAKLKQTFRAVVRCDKGTWYTGKVTME